MTPSTIVVDFDEQSGEALIHSLRVRGVNIAEEVAR
jgi:multisubunit Na+/H+ antiporter MnhE subunit